MSSASAVPAPHTGFFSLLQHYAQAAADENWYAAAVVTKEGSSYRKPGATMLVTPGGRTLGLVSGGCLEADIVMQACRAQQDGQARYVIYDSSDEENIAAELGLGCNGRIGVLVQELQERERALLLQLAVELEAGRSAFLLRCYEAERAEAVGGWALLDQTGWRLDGPAFDETPPLPGRGSRCIDWIENGARRWAVCRYQPPPRLCIVGGGVDAAPVVTLARLQGWRVTVIDHRAAHARSEPFAGVDVVREAPSVGSTALLAADAVILMSHNVEMDAGWLRQLQAAAVPPSYLGLLGPASRKQEVLERAGLAGDSQWSALVRGPMGLDLGGDTPEAVALSVIAECHQVLAEAGLVGA